MPKVIKKKTERKKPAREGEVKSSALQALETLKKRQKQVIIGAAAVIAVFVVIIVSTLISTSNYKEAYRLEREAAGYYYGSNEGESLTTEERLQKALELYQKSVDTKAIPSALYYLGNSYYSLGNYETAIQEYENFAQKFSGETKLLALVYQKLASAFFKTNKNNEALDTLNRLAEIDGGIFKDTALIRQATYYENAGEHEKAMEKYRELAAGFPMSPWSAEANAKIAAETPETSDQKPEEVKAAEEQTEEKKEKKPESK